jgi:hypothetical protein
MKHTIYEDAITHKFAVIRLPPRFIEGDKLPVPATARWFVTREEALATLSQLFDQEEDFPGEPPDHALTN